MVPLEDESSRMCIVYILTKEQKLPWVLGITIGVPVDLTQEEVQGYSINFDLNLASLTETQKEEVLGIALANPKLSGIFAIVYVDLESKRVIKIFSNQESLKNLGGE